MASILRQWLLAFRVKRLLTKLIRQNVRILGRLLPRREVRKALALARESCKELFGSNDSRDAADISQLKRVSRELAGTLPTDMARELSFVPAVEVEAQILKRVFGRMLGIKMSNCQTAELKLWNSPILVLNAFVQYCLLREHDVVNCRLSLGDVLRIFILNAEQHIRGGFGAEKSVNSVEGSVESKADPADLWRDRQVLLADEVAIEIHRRSSKIATSIYKEKTDAFEALYRRLRRNYDACCTKLKRILPGPARDKKAYVEDHCAKDLAIGKTTGG